VLKTEEITFRNTFFPDKHVCFLAGKSHPTLLQTPRYWVPNSSICHYSPLPFATICHYLRMFTDIHIFKTIGTTHTIRYLRLFAVHDYLLFAICYLGFPDTYPESFYVSA